MRLRTAQQTALLLAVLLKRSNQTRARVSNKTVMEFRGGKLYASFVTSLRTELEDLGVLLAELDRGGFGLLKISTLEGAKALTPDRVFTSEELLSTSSFADNAMFAELDLEEPDLGDDE